MERKKRAFNNVKSFLKNLRNIPIEEHLENYKAVYYKKHEPSNPKILKLVTNSSIENAVRKVKEQEKAKKFKTEYFAKMIEELDEAKKIKIKTGNHTLIVEKFRD